MTATITSTNIDTTEIASTIKHEVKIDSPLMDRPIVCYSNKAVMVLVGKFEIQHVNYNNDRDGALVQMLYQSGVTVK